MNNDDQVLDTDTNLDEELEDGELEPDEELDEEVLEALNVKKKKQKDNGNGLDYIPELERDDEEDPDF